MRIQVKSTTANRAVGLLLVRDRDGVFNVLDMLRFWATKWKRLKAEATLRAPDGFAVSHAMATGDKQVRSLPVSSQSEHGNGKLVKAP